MEWEPAASDEIAKAATPPLTVAVPSDVAPSRNCTVPVADVGATVAVNVTDCPTTDGFADEASVTVEAALFTVCGTAAEVLAAVFASPLYTAVMECETTASDEMASTGAPPI